MTPKEAAAKIYSEMTQEEKDTVKELGAGDMQEHAEDYAHNPGVVYKRHFVVDTLDEIDRLCGYVGDDE